MTIAKLTSDDLKDGDRENTQLQKLNELTTAVNNASGNGTPGVGTFSSLSVSGPVQFAAEISPAALTVSTNDWAPTGFTTATFVFIAATGAIDLTGLAGGLQGRMVWLWNTLANIITIKHQSISSAVGNRFYCPGGADIPLNVDRCVQLFYSLSAQSWMVVNVQN